MRYKHLMNILKTYELAIVDASRDLAMKLLSQANEHSHLFKCETKLQAELVSYQKLTLQLL